jgi:hypothetical protein
VRSSGFSMISDEVGKEVCGGLKSEWADRQTGAVGGEGGNQKVKVLKVSSDVSPFTVGREGTVYQENGRLTIRVEFNV